MYPQNVPVATIVRFLCAKAARSQVEGKQDLSEPKKLIVLLIAFEALGSIKLLIENHSSGGEGQCI